MQLFGEILKWVLRICTLGLSLLAEAGIKTAEYQKLPMCSRCVLAPDCQANRSECVGFEPLHPEMEVKV